MNSLAGSADTSPGADADSLPRSGQVAAEGGESIDRSLARALTLYRQRDLKGAASICAAVLDDHPSHFQALHLHGVVAAADNRPQEALGLLERATGVHGANPAVHNNLGLVLKDLRRLDDAVDSWRRCVAVDPGHAEGHRNLGIALQDLNRFEEAVEAWSRVIDLKPGSCEAWSNRGWMHSQLGRIEAALSDFRRALEIEPDNGDAQFRKAFTLLLAGRWQEGWDCYEWRWKSKQAKGHQRVFPQPVWQGTESLEDRTIFLHCEQGLGDVIQFCRYAKLVKALGAKVVLEAPRPLLRLFGGLDGVDTLVEKGRPVPDFDLHIPLLSLPRALGTTLDAVPVPPTGLGCEPALKAHWSTRLGARSKPRLGLVWSSTSSFKADALRSMEFASFIACIPRDRFELICLQKEVKAADRPAFEAHGGVRHFGDEIRDFADTAALAGCMDLVVSTCTSVPHLTASLGVPTWVLLQHVPDWRWLLEREDSPWYPSVRLFRQGRDRDWKPVIRSVAQALAQRFA